MMVKVEQLRHRFRRTFLVTERTFAQLGKFSPLRQSGKSSRPG